ncbi:MAG: thiosulfate sulfurtransferase [Deltaproteobacteria bacterium]|nr:thiosulfate sulfurtransferase [Deltaproteobacteria bacterium]
MSDGSDPEISPEGAQALLEAGSATFVDVRDGSSYRSGHIPGALHVGDHNIGEFVSAADKSRPVVVYCYHGNSSLGGASYLRSQGFEQVWSMSSGWAGWYGRPMEESPRPDPPPRPRAPRVTPAPAPKRQRRRDRWLGRIRSLRGGKG